MTIAFIDLHAQRARIAEDIARATSDVLEHGQYVMGPEVRQLEEALCHHTGARWSFTCANGTDALQLALMALDVNRGDAVFVPSFTFVATAEAVALVGATPVFVDVDPETFNMCPDSLAAAIDAVTTAGTLTPRAVIPVDLFGQPAVYDRIGKIAREHGLKVIADAAQSFGASRGNTPVGRMADITTTSFFPAKPLGCYGDGGALFTDDEDLGTLLDSIRNHGKGTDRYDNIRIGMNSRLDTLQAAILLCKLRIFEEEVTLRQKVADGYIAGLESSFRVQKVLPATQSVWAQFTLIAEDRDDIRDRLSAKGIPTAVYYPKPNHLQPPYASAPRAPDGLPHTEYLRDHVFSLPMHPYLAADVQERIIEEVGHA